MRVKRLQLAAAAGLVTASMLWGSTATFGAGGAGTVTIKKVDAKGRLLPGATFEGWSCTSFDGDPMFTCVSLNDYPFFRDDLPNTGITDALTNEVYTQGGWNLPVNQCLVVRETAPPEGYIAAPDPLVVCKGPGGWTVANAAGIELDTSGGTFRGGSLGSWKVTNNQSTVATTMTLVNRKESSTTPSQPETTPQTPRGIGADTDADQR